MATTEAKTEYYIGFLGGIWESLAKYAYPIVRITCGAMLIPHGYVKLFAGTAKGTAFFMAMTLGGHGKAGAGPFAGSWLPVSYYLGVLEFVGGIMLVVGLLTRVVAAQVVGFMLVAAFFVHAGFPSYFWNNGGMEMPLMWMLLAIVVLIRGGGDFSIDKMLGKEF